MESAKSTAVGGSELTYCAGSLWCFVVSVRNGSSEAMIPAPELYSFVQPHSEDLLLVVAGGVAIIVDLYNPAPGVPAPAAAQTIMDTIVDRGLDVDIIAGGHGGFVSFEEFASLLP